MLVHLSVYCTGQHLNSNSDYLSLKIYFVFPNIMHKKNSSKDLLSTQIIIPQRTSEKKNADSYTVLCTSQKKYYSIIITNSMDFYLIRTLVLLEQDACL